MDKNLINPLIIIISLLILLFSLVIAKKQIRDNSAVLARIRLLRMGQSATNAKEKATRPTRQIVGDGLSFKGQKAKRYRCYLVDDDDVNVGEEIDDQLKEQIIKEHGGKSFFVGFQRDREERNGNNILGWEERNSEGPRRSEGTRSRYLFSKRRTTTEGPATEKPIIEYLDYETERIGNEHLNKVENATPISPVQFSRTTKTIPKSDSKFLQILNLAKISRRPLPSVENQQQRKLSSSLESNGESGADEGPETGKELEEEENYNDLYITTTASTISTTTYSKKSALRQPPTNSLPRAQGTPTPYSIEQLKQRRGQIAPKAIPHEILVESGMEDEQEEKEEIHPMRATTQQPFHHFIAQLHQPNSQSTPPRRINAAPNLWPGQQQQFQNTQYNQQQLLFPKQQQQQQSMTQRNRNPQRDSQGRALILSPEHCKMMDNYAQIYGLQSPTNVMNFVHNNCAFAKIYLPAASCAEIDILVQSCYQRRN